MEQRNNGTRRSVQLNFAKKFISGKLLQTFLSCLSKDPEENVTKAFSMLQRMSLDRGIMTKENIEGLKRMYETDPVLRQYIGRLLREISPELLGRLACNVLINHAVAGVNQQVCMRDKLGVQVPSTILIDPTSACNLRCTGCWADDGQQHVSSLEPELLRRILDEANELGIYFIVMSGGEPFLYPHLFDIAGQYPEMTFMLYTNGTRIDDETADRLLETGNMVPFFSLEGGRERTDGRRGTGVFDQITAAMGRLRKRGVPFGISLTLTRENIDEVTSDEFMDFLIDQGVLFGWSFHYIPVGDSPDFRLMITPEQRAYLAQRIPQIRTQKPIKIADFWNDGELTGGCIAGGREYFHINAGGQVKPCAFVPYTADSIRDRSITEILSSPLFRAYQKRQPFSSSHLRPCPIIDTPQALRDIIEESGAEPAYPGAESLVDPDTAERLDRRAEIWRKQTARMEAREHAEA